ncbi:hypothetical protein RvY_02035 [Ramazzottius varieornatus]|uniref:Uncharacterized protein n=1 Tax=Ramazzottius varieornatus TaxID=947166 RepID=A0A1D1UTH9_RAMVA|nr:hypothetical protein RvY_02035 [Ramazzottius varieornatus]
MDPVTPVGTGCRNTDMEWDDVLDCSALRRGVGYFEPVANKESQWFLRTSHKEIIQSRYRTSLMMVLLRNSVE